MIVITSLSKLKGCMETDSTFLNGLGAKDRVYLLGKEEEAIPIPLFHLLSRLKTKVEFVAVPEGEQGGLIKAFLCGALSQAAKPEEDVAIMLEGDQLTVPGYPNVKWVPSLKIQKTAPKRTRKKAAAAKKETVENQDPFLSALMGIPGMEGYRSMVEEKGELIKECLQDASDGEIGLQILLETKLGREAGKGIWETIHESFVSLKKVI